MVDLTPDFRKLVNEISASSTENGIKKRIDILPPVKKNVREVQDEFLKEAYRIAYLNVSRQNPSNLKYSTSPTFLLKDNLDQGLSPRIDPSITTLTDKQRDEIDLHAKTIIQQCLNRIKELEGTEQESKSPSRPSSVIQTIINEESETPTKSDNEMNSNIESDYDIEQHLSAEQKMVLERENESMMKELATTLEQVKYVIFKFINFEKMARN
ncbi:840_t:CDS:2 [Racocetra fulgida]|uniref:840_t:CDS:1 n=1 Tax=Racocetra fulgida TaxID=60492 RepID=A0A9N9BBG3_9GLOM|nr:840_t:CDS:2 [Racocetra fulgida]